MKRHPTSPNNSRGRTVMWVALAVVLAVTGSAVQARRRLEAERDSWSKRRVETVAKARATEAAIAQAREAEAEHARALKEVEAELAERETAEKPRKAEAPEPDKGMIFAAHPEVQARFEKAVRANLQQKYASLLARLTLSAEQSESLLGVLVREVGDQLDLQGAARAHGLAEDDAAAERIRAQQLAERTEEKRKILDPEALRVLQEFERGDGLRDDLKAVAELTLFSGSPLTRQQAEQLIAQVTKASPTRDGGVKVAWDEVDWDQALAGASAYMPESQIAALKAYASLQRLVQKVPQFFESKTPL